MSSRVLLVSTDLVSWLRSQLDEHERIAREAMPGPWTVTGTRGCEDPLCEREYVIEWQVCGDWKPDRSCGVVADLYVQPLRTPDGLDVRLDEDGHPEFPAADDTIHDAAHIAANDPAHVLRTVAAHRAILDQHPADEEREWRCAECRSLRPCPTVKLVASIYADRPGFNPSWRADT